MKILITGGNGFIARNLFEYFNGICAIESLNSEELNLLDSQKVFDFIKKGCFDAVVHTATYDAAPKHSTKDPAKVLEINLRMFFNVARCKDFYGKMVYFGSGAEFNRRDWMPKMKENYFDQNVPADQYGFSKYIMTKYAQMSSNIYNLRLFGVFGRYDDWRTRFIPNACCHAVLSLPVTVKQNRRFDFLYIDDLARIVEWLIGSQPHEKIYNVCTGKVYDLMTLAEKIVTISGKNLEILAGTIDPGAEYSGDNSLLLSEMGDFEFTPVDDSLRLLYNWYDANRNFIEEDKL